jgi:hypothetical protein
VNSTQVPVNNTGTGVPIGGGNGQPVGQVVINLPGSGTGTVSVVIQPVNPDVMRVVDNSAVRSVPVDISLDQAVPAFEAKICLQTDKGGRSRKDFCLGYIANENEFAHTNLRPKWHCEDSCLEENGDQLCGYTDHFTSFAILLSTSNSVVSGGGCGSKLKTNYITGSQNGDIALTVSVIAFVFLIAVLVFVMFSYIPILRKLALGPEGYRIYRLTHQSSKGMSRSRSTI